MLHFCCCLLHQATRWRPSRSTTLITHFAKHVCPPGYPRRRQSTDFGLQPREARIFALASLKNLPYPYRDGSHLSGPGSSSDSQAQDGSGISGRPHMYYFQLLRLNRIRQGLFGPKPPHTRPERLRTMETNCKPAFLR